jgi:hypothetical protein
LHIPIADDEIETRAQEFDQAVETPGVKPLEVGLEAGVLILDDGKPPEIGISNEQSLPRGRIGEGARVIRLALDVGADSDVQGVALGGEDEVAPLLPRSVPEEVGLGGACGG